MQAEHSLPAPAEVLPLARTWYLVCIYDRHEVFGESQSYTVMKSLENLSHTLKGRADNSISRALCFQTDFLGSAPSTPTESPPSEPRVTFLTMRRRQADGILCSFTF